MTSEKFLQSLPENDSKTYFVDVFTSQSVLQYETQDILEALFVCSQYVRPAQMISLYAYDKDPLSNRLINNILSHVTESKGENVRCYNTTGHYIGPYNRYSCISQSVPILSTPAGNPRLYKEFKQPYSYRLYN